MGNSKKTLGFEEREPRFRVGIPTLFDNDECGGDSSHVDVITFGVVFLISYSDDSSLLHPEYF